MHLFLHEVHKPINGERKTHPASIAQALSTRLASSEALKARPNHELTAKMLGKQSAQIVKTLVKSSENPESSRMAYLIFDRYDTLEDLVGLAIVSCGVDLYNKATNGPVRQQVPGKYTIVDATTVGNDFDMFMTAHKLAASNHETLGSRQIAIEPLESGPEYAKFLNEMYGSPVQGVYTTSEVRWSIPRSQVFGLADNPRLPLDFRFLP